MEIKSREAPSRKDYSRGTAIMWSWPGTDRGDAGFWADLTPNAGGDSGNRLRSIAAHNKKPPAPGPARQAPSPVETTFT